MFLLNFYCPVLDQTGIESRNSLSMHMLVYMLPIYSFSAFLLLLHGKKLVSSSTAQHCFHSQNLNQEKTIVHMLSAGLSGVEKKFRLRNKSLQLIHFVSCSWAYPCCYSQNVNPVKIILLVLCGRHVTKLHAFSWNTAG